MTYEALEEKKKRRFRRASVILAAAAVLILIFFLILVLFRVQKVEVSGNHHVTEEELEAQIMKGPVSGNSLFLRLFHHHPHVTDEAFVDRITVDYVNRHTVRITVKEKALVGYVSYQGSFWYFDSEGRVLVQADQPEKGDEALIAAEDDNPGADDGVEEVSSASSAKEATDAETSSSASLSSGKEDTDSNADLESSSISSGTSAQDAEEGKSQEQGTDGTAQDASSQTADSSSGTVDPYYIPLVKGFSVTELKVGEVMTVDRPSVFDALKSITEIINKQGIDPDYVQFAKDGTISLVVGTITAKLGSDDHLEDKLEEMAAILPKAQGLSGILHLENFDGTQKRIVFDKSTS